MPASASSKPETSPSAGVCVAGVLGACAARAEPGGGRRRRRPEGGGVELPGTETRPSETWKAETPAQVDGPGKADDDEALSTAVESTVGSVVPNSFSLASLRRHSLARSKAVLEVEMAGCCEWRAKWRQRRTVWRQGLFWARVYGRGDGEKEWRRWRGEGREGKEYCVYVRMYVCVCVYVCGVVVVGRGAYLMALGEIESGVVKSGKGGDRNQANDSDRGPPGAAGL